LRRQAKNRQTCRGKPSFASIFRQNPGFIVHAPVDTSHHTTTHHNSTDSALPRLILGSSSIYRKELLSRLGLPFETMIPDIDETPQPGETPEATALRLAREKAAAIGRAVGPALVIGSDQVATLDGLQIGKPGNHANALSNCN
jgi:hypothetical protein